MKRLSALWTNGKVYTECRFHGDTDPLVGNVSFDSRTCVTGSVFIAIEGLHDDGHDHVPEAIANGAVAIVHKKNLATYDSTVLFIMHPNPRRVASLFCSALTDGIPPTVIGVTGTDGKTTTCDFLWQILNGMGAGCGLLSTVAMDDGSGRTPSPFRQSTPEVAGLFPFLNRCHANGIDTVVLEATSHGLSEEGSRLADIRFSGAVYTTFTSEHLEFHGTKERYADAKLNLARSVVPGGWIVMPAVFPLRDRIAAAIAPSVRVFTHALDRDGVFASLTATTKQASLTRRLLSFDDGKNRWTASLPIGPDFFTENLLGALLAASLASGVRACGFTSAVQHLAPVSGRFEIVSSPLPFVIIIDFAHTADAFERLFRHVRTHRSEGRLVALFGAAGERDRSKRSPMGAAAAAWCDVIFLTDEDPRGEESMAIFTDIEAGMSEGKKPQVFKIPDRAEAISSALRFCAGGDTLLILGKGHERTIQYARQTVPWNEREAVDGAIAEMLGESAEAGNG